MMCRINRRFVEVKSCALLLSTIFAGASVLAEQPTPTPSRAASESLRPQSVENVGGERVFVTSGCYPMVDNQNNQMWRVDILTFESMLRAGANTPIEGLRQVPYFLGTTATENDSVGGDGSALINLYGLGPDNVLTLINGRRAFSFSNINAIPFGAIGRVEITNQGVGSGSDSAGGLVNFTLVNGPGERPYEGAELYALYGNTTDSDAHVRQVYLRGGVTGLDGKVSIAAVGEYYSRANLYSRDREISATADKSNDSTGLGWGGLNDNSPTYAGRISVQAGATALGFTATGQLTLGDLTNNQVAAGSYRNFDTPFDTDPFRFNFRAFTPSIPAVEKAMYYVTGRYRVFGEALQIYGDLMYSKAKQDNGTVGTPFSITSAIGVTRGLTEARQSIFNPAGDFLTSVRYRLQQELGDRKSLFDDDYQRYTAGVNGNFNFKDNGFISHLGYDAGFVYEDFSQERTDSGDVTRGAIVNLIGQNLFNPFIGQFAPVTGFAPTYLNGVPTGQTAFYDNRLAARLAGNGGAAYVAHSFAYERDWLGDIKLNAHLFPNIWNGGIELAIGAEHSETQTHSVPDATLEDGDQLGFSAPENTKFKEEVDAFFLEMSLPFVTSVMNIPFVRTLEVTAGVRFEDYHEKDQYSHATADYDNGWTPEIGVRYQPIADLTLRATWRQAIRPPVFEDLFAPIRQQFPTFFDPALPPPGPPAGIFTGGNPNLEPETTDIYSVGLVWEPKFAPGFTLSIDAYQMFTRDPIVDADTFAQHLIANDIRAPLNDLGLAGCGVDLINNLGVIRDPNGGGLYCVNSATGNAGKRFVEGINISSVYEIPTEHYGLFTISGGYNHFFAWKLEPGYEPTHSFLGTYNNGTFPLAPGAIPWNKGFIRGEWEWRGFDFVATGNYIGDFRDDSTFFNEFSGVRTVPSYITLDLQLSYEWSRPDVYPPSYAKDVKDSKVDPRALVDTSTIWQRMLWGTKVTVGVNNAFDRNPPSVLAAPNDNYDTSLYSIRNRYWYVALTKKF